MSVQGDIARKLLFEYNLLTAEDCKFERWDQTDGNTVVRFANVESPSNIYVMYDPHLDVE